MNNIIKNAAINALGTAVYIILVVSTISHVPKFGNDDSIFLPILMLMLFVFSAAVTGLLVFGRPILWYLDGRKKDAMSLLLTTLGIFFLIAVLTFGIFYFFENKDSKSVIFTCLEGKSINATFHPKNDTSVDLALSDGRKLTLPHAISASGARYANTNESIVFWNKGEGAFITEGTMAKKTFSSCVLGAGG